MAKKTNVMASSDQVQELTAKIKKISDNLRGTMDASRFKDYILGMLFYRFLSERTVSYIEKELLAKEGKTYLEAVSDHTPNSDIAAIFEDLANSEGFEASYSGLVKYWSVEHLGYFIEPNDLFSRLYERALIKENRDVNPDKFSVEHLADALNNLVKSTEGHPSEAAFEGLFYDVTRFEDLGTTPLQQSEKMAQLIIDIGQLSFTSQNAQIDILGTAYMEMIGQFASDAGKKAGEFFTPIPVSKLLAKLATVGLEEIKSACDPAAGSGSLLLQVKAALPKHKVGHYFAQELTRPTYNLLRMNLLLHDIQHSQFTVYNDDTLNHDNFYKADDGKAELFTVQVANPPFSADWQASLGLGDDPRYKGIGLPPKQYGEMGFVEHMAYHMDEDGRIAVVLPHGVTTRKEEYDIRKYLIDKNYIDAIIGLPANMFHTTGSAVLIMVLRKYRNGNADNVLFINASEDFTKGRPKNYLSDVQIDRIVKAYTDRTAEDKYAAIVPISEIKKNDYNLSVNRYCSNAEEETPVDITATRKNLTEINAKIAETDAKLAGWFKQLGI